MGDKLSERNELRHTFLGAIESLKDGYQGNSLTDLFVQVDGDSGEILIFDDESNKIAHNTISVWEERSNSDLPRKEIMERNLKGLRHVIADLKRDDSFADLDVFTPFSINLADEEFSVIEELLLIEDDEIVFLEDDFLEKLEKDFDDFVEKLLKE